jgi:hypothetical protein
VSAPSPSGASRRPPRDVFVPPAPATGPGPPCPHRPRRPPTLPGGRRPPGHRRRDRGAAGNGCRSRSRDAWRDGRGYDGGCAGHRVRDVHLLRLRALANRDVGANATAEPAREHDETHPRCLASGQLCPVIVSSGTRATSRVSLAPDRRRHDACAQPMRRRARNATKPRLHFRHCTTRPPSSAGTRQRKHDHSDAQRRRAGLQRRAAYELPSRWRRSSASMNASRSPSSTASTLPVS